MPALHPNQQKGESRKQQATEGMQQGSKVKGCGWEAAGAQEAGITAWKSKQVLEFSRREKQEWEIENIFSPSPSIHPFILLFSFYLRKSLIVLERFSQEFQEKTLLFK